MHFFHKAPTMGTVIHEEEVWSWTPAGYNSKTLCEEKTCRRRDTFMNWDMTEIKASTVYVHEIPVRRHTRSTEK